MTKIKIIIFFSQYQNPNFLSQPFITFPHSYPFIFSIIAKKILTQHSCMWVILHCNNILLATSAGTNVVYCIILSKNALIWKSLWLSIQLMRIALLDLLACCFESFVKPLPPGGWMAESAWFDASCLWNVIITDNQLNFNMIVMKICLILQSYYPSINLSIRHLSISFC